MPHPLRLQLQLAPTSLPLHDQATPPQDLVAAFSGVMDQAHSQTSVADLPIMTLGFEETSVLGCLAQLCTAIVCIIVARSDVCLEPTWSLLAHPVSVGGEKK